MTDEPSSIPVRRQSRWKRVTLIISFALVVYLLVAYIIMPGVWKRYVQRHPSLEDSARHHEDRDGIPGDPINVALIGTKAEVDPDHAGREVASGRPAHAAQQPGNRRGRSPQTARMTTPRSATSTYSAARRTWPSSNRSATDPRHRHHVRFWQTDKLDEDGRPVWVGSAVFDERVGLSRTTGQITHVTAADVDAERELPIPVPRADRRPHRAYVVDGFHKVREGKNGGGDPWRTDGDLDVGVIKPANPKNEH